MGVLSGTDGVLVEQMGVLSGTDGVLVEQMGVLVQLMSVGVRWGR